MIRSPSSPSRIAPAILGIVLAFACQADAGLVLGSYSPATISYQVDSIGPGASGGPTFNGDGTLASPGNGFPTLLGQASGTSSQSSSVNSIKTDFISSATTDPNSSIGYVPASFGTATTDVYAATSGSIGGYTSRGGIFWTSTTRVADNLNGSSSLASVSISKASAMFTNTGTSSIRVTPGSMLSVTGTLGQAPGSFVAAGLSSSYSLFLGDSPLGQTSLGSIALAANASQNTVSSTGGNGNGAASTTLIGQALSGTGSSFNPSGSITLIPGETILFSAVLTLISDPGSEIGLSDTVTPGYPSDPQYYPDFGSFALAVPGSNPVPEPSTALLVGSGLAAAGAWGRRRARLARDRAA